MASEMLSEEGGSSVMEQYAWRCTTLGEPGSLGGGSWGSKGEGSSAGKRGDTPPSSPIDKGLGLRAVLFAEFDNVHGPVVTHQWPEGFVPKKDVASARERMEATKEMGLYGTYLIPHEALSGHTCTWTHKDHTFLTYPITYEDPKYFRNQYRTNLIFVFSAETDIKQFHPVIRRVSQAFQMLERDFEWLSRQGNTLVKKHGPRPSQEGERLLPGSQQQQAAQSRSESLVAAQLTASLFPVVDVAHALVDATAPLTPGHLSTSGETDHFPTQSSTVFAEEPDAREDPTSTEPDHEATQSAPHATHEVFDMPDITSVLHQVVEGLNTKQEAVIEMNLGVILTFKYFPPIPNPPEVFPWDVPVLLKHPSAEDLNDWDLTLQMILPRLDDSSTVAVIAHTLCMSLSTCCFAVRHLVYYGYVKTVDVFQYTNIYTLLPVPFAAFSSSTLEAASLATVSRDVSDPISAVALTNFYQSFGAEPLARSSAAASHTLLADSLASVNDTGGHASDLGGSGKRHELKRLEAVLRYFDEKMPPDRSGTGTYRQTERKLEKWRYEWKDEVRRKLHVKNA
eukprot:gene2838-4446_t